MISETYGEIAFKIVYFFIENGYVCSFQIRDLKIVFEKAVAIFT